MIDINYCSLSIYLMSKYFIVSSTHGHNNTDKKARNVTHFNLGDFVISENSCLHDHCFLCSRYFL